MPKVVTALPLTAAPARRRFIDYARTIDFACRPSPCFQLLKLSVRSVRPSSRLTLAWPDDIVNRNCYNLIPTSKRRAQPASFAVFNFKDTRYSRVLATIIELFILILR